MQELFHISFSGISTFKLILLLAFTALLLIRILYLLLVTGGIIFKRKQTDEVQSGEPISMLLTYRNEEENLLNYLPEILKIDNTNFEVVAVDDFSQDNSLSVLGVMKNGNGKLRISSLNQETRFSEKLAQNIALKAAKNSWVMVIPASISVFGERWLQSISGCLTSGKDVVMNYTNIVQTGHFYNRLFRIELFWQQVKSAGFTACGIPFVYSEENVAFRKEKYFEAGGYGQKVKEPFANLELLINKFIRKKKVDIRFQKETSIQKDEQVKRHNYFNLLKKSIRIERNLPGYKRAVLFIDDWTRLLFLPLLAVVIVFVSELWLLITIAIGFKIIIHLFIIKTTLNHLNERKIFISSLLYELLMPYYKVFYRWHFNRRSRKQRWRSNI
ncbi:MAG TPA: glycosyltransferase [Draconibacterium sp.]|nr:glycosyltransferase [Draconibacterium sp.]